MITQEEKGKRTNPDRGVKERSKEAEKIVSSKKGGIRGKERCRR